MGLVPMAQIAHNRSVDAELPQLNGDRGGSVAANDLMDFERATGVAPRVECKTRFAVPFHNNHRSSTHFMNKSMDLPANLTPTGAEVDHRQPSLRVSGVATA